MAQVEEGAGMRSEEGAGMRSEEGAGMRSKEGQHLAFLIAATTLHFSFAISFTTDCPSVH